MAGNARKIYVSSPVFGREDEERYHYVDTEVDGMLTGRTDEELELGADGPSFSVCHDRKSDEQSGHGVQSSMLLDSLESNPGDLNAVAENKNSIVVVDPARYEDLMMGTANDRHMVEQQASGNGRANVVPRWVDVDAGPCHYYLHDDAEEYEEAQLERQHQRCQARRAHVPHLELCHSDDEPSDGEAAFDLELTDGHVPPGVGSKNKVNPGNRRRVNFGALPRNSNSSDSSQLLNSLVYHPYKEVENRKADHNEGRLHNDVYKNQPHKEYHAADSSFDVPENGQADASSQSFSANQQQLPIHPLPPSNQTQAHQYSPAFQSQGQIFQASSNYKRRSDAAAIDFVVANRQNINRRQQQSYGQIHSRKKGKNMVDSVHFQHRPADTASGPPDVAEHKPPVALELSEGRREESDVMPSAEQLWQSRSQSLAARKELAAESSQIPGKAQRSGGKARPAQNRVAPRSVAVPSQSTMAALHQQHPNTQQHQLSTSSSLRPTVLEMPRNSAAQKVSVDINLNVVSPRPVLNQPSTSLPLQYTESSAARQDVYQYSESAQTQAYTGPGHTHQAVNHQLPIRYNYSHPQSLAATGSDAPHHAVHPYQLQHVTQNHQYFATNIVRENSVPTTSSQFMSPYAVLPPVGSAREGMPKPHSAPQVSNELVSPKGPRSVGYADQYRRQNKKLYKAYTIADYRKLKKEMKPTLGTLGPDFESDSHKERKEKVQRKQDYARLIQERNRLDLQQTKHPKQKESEGDEQLGRRRLAIEYAKKVPKPKVLPRRNSTDNASNSSSSSTTRAAAAALSAGADDTRGDFMTVNELQRLQERHRMEQQQVALLWQNNS